MIKSSPRVCELYSLQRASFFISITEELINEQFFMTPPTINGSLPALLNSTIVTIVIILLEFPAERDPAPQDNSLHSDQEFPAKKEFI